MERWSTIAILVGVGLLIASAVIEFFSLFFAIHVPFSSPMKASVPTMQTTAREKVFERSKSPDARSEDYFIKLTETLRSAKYAFNHPDVMYLTHRSQITLTLAVTEAAAIEQVQKQFGKEVEGQIKSGQTQYSPVMTATLRGRDFKIEPSEAQQKSVLLSTKGPTEWTWYVEALEVGDAKLLRLELAADLDQGGPKLPPIVVQTFQARIQVDVRTFDRFLYEAKRMTPLAQVLSGAGATLTILGFVGGLWRRFGKKS